MFVTAMGRPAKAMMEIRTVSNELAKHFASIRRKGWAAWGNQIDKFGEAA